MYPFMHNVVVVRPTHVHDVSCDQAIHTFAPSSQCETHTKIVQLCDDAISQGRGGGSNCLVFLKAHPRDAMGQCQSRVLVYLHKNSNRL